MNDDKLPPHVEQTVRAVEELHAQHRENANPVDRLLERIRLQVSRPAFIVALMILVGFWTIANCWWKAGAVDPPPYAYLQLLLSLGAVCLTILVLATQRRADGLASHREKLILQLAFVSEQKAAKVIALVEELRRDSPQVRDRADHEAEQMTESVDAQAVSNALRNTDSDSPMVNEL
jgi:uncharacterized membrane protein